MDILVGNSLKQQLKERFLLEECFLCIYQEQITENGWKAVERNKKNFGLTMN